MINIRYNDDYDHRIQNEYAGKDLNLMKVLLSNNIH